MPRERRGSRERNQKAFPLKQLFNGRKKGDAPKSRVLGKSQPRKVKAFSRRSSEKRGGRTGGKGSRKGADHGGGAGIPNDASNVVSFKGRGEGCVEGGNKDFRKGGESHIEFR